MNPKKRIKRNCRGCGIEFEFIPWQKKQFCDRKCYDSNRDWNPMDDPKNREKVRIARTGKPHPHKITPRPQFRGKNNPACQPGVGEKISRTKRKNNPIDDKRKRYKSLVLMETRRQSIETLEHFEKRGVWGEDVYHLDHIISIKDGYDSGIDYKEIANIKNLRFIPSYENNKKGAKSG